MISARSRLGFESRSRRERVCASRPPKAVATCLTVCSGSCTSRGCHLYFDLDGRCGGASGSMACEPPCPLPSPCDPVKCDRAPEQPGEDTARCVAEEAAGVLRDLIAAQAPADIANSVVIETLTIESAHGGDKFSQHVLLQAVRSGGC